MTAMPAAAGIGLRHAHCAEIIETHPRVAWFEAHAENYFCGGKPLHFLEAIRKDYPVSLHGVGLSLGSAEKPDAAHLQKLKEVCDRVQPCLVSEHVSWSRAGNTWLPDLLPLPYTEEALDALCRNVESAQEALGRKLLMENPSGYMRLPESVIPEGEFLAELARRTGCGLLLDVNNLYVSSRNLGFDAAASLRRIPGEAVGEIHLAGYHDAGGALIDDHGSAVHAPVWELYAETVRLLGAKPTLIEWDTSLPPLPVLLDEAAKAARVLEKRGQHEAA